jgi:metal transporter CNNM
MLWLHALALAPAMNDVVFEADDIQFGTPLWFVYAGVSCLLVLFAGIMSGLTLGLMSLGLVELEILQRSGTTAEKKQAGSCSAVKKKLYGFRARNLLVFLCLLLLILGIWFSHDCSGYFTRGAKAAPAVGYFASV